MRARSSPGCASEAPRTYRRSPGTLTLVRPAPSRRQTASPELAGSTSRPEASASARHARTASRRASRAAATMTTRPTPSPRRSLASCWRQQANALRLERRRNPQVVSPCSRQTRASPTADRAASSGFQRQASSAQTPRSPPNPAQPCGKRLNKAKSAARVKGAAIILRRFSRPPHSTALPPLRGNGPKASCSRRARAARRSR